MKFIAVNLQNYVIQFSQITKTNWQGKFFGLV